MSKVKGQMSNVKCRRSNVEKGFTLIELLIVITIIAILASIVFVALNPAKRFRAARDSSRWSDVSAVIDAIKVHQIDNDGEYLTAVGNMNNGEVYMITDGGGVDCDAQNLYCVTNVTAEALPGDHCVDLAPLVVGGYVGAVPTSPDGSGTWSGSITGYTLQRDNSGIITLRACEAEEGGEIWIAR